MKFYFDKEIHYYLYNIQDKNIDDIDYILDSLKQEYKIDSDAVHIIEGFKVREFYYLNIKKVDKNFKRILLSEVNKYIKVNGKLDRNDFFLSCVTLIIWVNFFLLVGLI